jgi:ankyrin repeat protein
MEWVSHLLEVKAKLNAADQNGTTVLMFAMQFPDLLDFVLIQKKLKIDAQNHEGQTAAMMAAAMNYTDALLTLIEAGADLEVEDEQGRGISSYASTNEVEEVLSEFVGFH